MADRCDSNEPGSKARCERASGHGGFHTAGFAESEDGMIAWGEGTPGPAVEAELITAAVADFQELSSLERRDLRCDRCGAPVTVAYFFQLCDGCLEQVGR